MSDVLIPHDLKVLVVDDISHTRRIARRLLQELRLTDVDEAASGSEAIKKIKSNHFGLILCDLNLNDMRGVEVLREVRKDVRQQHVPFVMITSDALAQDIIEAKNAGVSGYVLKPLTVHNLSENILRALIKHQEQDK